MECMKFLNEDVQKKTKKEQILYIVVRDHHIMTSAKLLDYYTRVLWIHSYKFSVDLIETTV